MLSIDQRFRYLSSSTIELQTVPLVWHDRNCVPVNYGPVEATVEDIDEKTIYVSYSEGFKYAIDIIYLFSQLNKNTFDISGSEYFLRIRIANSCIYKPGETIMFNTLYVCKIISQVDIILFLMSDDTVKSIAFSEESNNVRERIISIYTDGGCCPNPGIGGWAYVVVDDNDIIFENYGSSSYTTNNIMELTAVIKALNYISKQNVYVTVYTDSKYVKDGITQWISVWRVNNWRTSKGKTVKNVELWKDLDNLNKSLSPKWEWIKGHSGNLFNDRADELATKGMKEI